MVKPHWVLVSLAALLSACSQSGPSTPDGRISPFSPNYEIELRVPQPLGPAALALSPSLAGDAPSDDPFARAVECAAAVLKLRDLARQFSEQVDGDAMLALDRAHRYYIDEARRLAEEGGNSSAERAVAVALDPASMAAPAAAKKAVACLRTQTPPGLQG